MWNSLLTMMMSAALVTMVMLGLLTLFGLDRSIAPGTETEKALTQDDIAQEQAGIAKTQKGVAVANLATATLLKASGRLHAQI